MFSLLLFILPFLSLRFYLSFIISYFIVAIAFAIFATWKEKRWDLLIVPLPYLLLVFLNAYIFLEQMIKEIFLRQNNLHWFKPERVVM